MYNDKTFKHGQMAAILFMQMRWSLFSYELLEPQTALEWSLFFTDNAFMSNQSTVLITSPFSPTTLKKEKLDLLPKANLHIN